MPAGGLLSSSDRGLDFGQITTRSPLRCTQAFQSRSPRFSPTRTFSGKDPRALLAEDPFKGRHPFQYQSPHVYRQRRQPFQSDSFRYGIMVKDPARPTSPFQSTLPRLTATRLLEPIKRETYGPELMNRQLTYMPLLEGPALR